MSDLFHIDKEAWKIADRLNHQVKCLACDVVVYDVPENAQQEDDHSLFMRLRAIKSNRMLHFCKQCKQYLKGNNGRLLHGVVDAIKDRNADLLAVFILVNKINKHGKNQNN